MARQEVVLGKMVIKQNAVCSDWFDLYAGPGAAAVVTIYGPGDLNGDAAVIEVSPNAGGEFRRFIHKGAPVLVDAGEAVDLPLPACRAMRVHATEEQETERQFAVLALLEMD